MHFNTCTQVFPWCSKNFQEHFARIEKYYHRGLRSFKWLKVLSAPSEFFEREDCLSLVSLIRWSHLYFFLDFLSIVSLKQWLLYCCCVWPLCQGQRADIMIFATVSVVTSPSCAVGEDLQAMVWGRGLEAPVEGSWCMSCAGCSREQQVFSTPYQCSAHSLLQTWLSWAVLGSTVVVLLDSSPCEKLKSCSCLSLLFSCALFPPSSPFPVFLKPAKMRRTHTHWSLFPCSDGLLWWGNKNVHSYWSMEW